MQVLVRDNNVDQGLRALKKKRQRVRQNAQAISRQRKATRKKMQREGLLVGRKRTAAR